MFFKLLNGEITFLDHKNIELIQSKNVYFLRGFVHRFVKLIFLFSFLFFKQKKPKEKKSKKVSV